MHTTEVVDQRQISDECIAITVRCCQDSITDSVTTIMNVHVLSSDDIDVIVDKHHDYVKTRHEGLLAGMAHLTTLQNRTKTHK